MRMGDEMDITHAAIVTLLGQGAKDDPHTGVMMVS
jgi:hypothetical protein